MVAVNADRNLLFGLLALQNGLIDQDQLVAAFRAWSRDKRRQIAEYLVERGDLGADERGAVQAMVGLHEKKHGGSAEKSLAAIPAKRSTRESLAALGDADIARTLTNVAFVAVASQPDTDADADRTSSYSVGVATSDGQRFRVLRPHARGGLGAVFVALDGELHREVALKQILESHADDPVSRQRFVNEAEITGGLEHPGVVPVYGLGTGVDGRPYYAMRFIRGDSLKDAIAKFHADAAKTPDPSRRSLALRGLLRRFTDVCNAVDYAHSRGVIHRDLKPSNIIVGKHGETLVVDWGLAKAVGRADPSVAEQTLAPSSGGSSQTVPGSALGTPAYMSPEQARGELDRLVPRSDVYSLGATLYCLLTGKPPFEGDDIGVILRAAQDGLFARPSERAPTLDPALEAICLKAMASQAEHRYPTAKSLADDLDRWMADEPVRAWREPLSRQVLRWCRRNRTAVTALAASVLVALAGTGAVLAVQTRAKDRLQQANRDLTNANDRVAKVNADLKSANEREKQRFSLAMDAINLFTGEVSRDLLLKEKQFEGLRTKLLKGAADFYGRLEAHLKGQTDRESLAALGHAYYELGDLTAQIGDQTAAMAVHRKALAVRRALASEPRADVSSKLDVAQSLLATGWLQRATGDTPGARASLEDARGLADVAEKEKGTTGIARAVLGTAYFRLAFVLSQMGDKAGALASYDRALAVQQKMVDANPGVSQFQQHLASTHANLGLLLSEMGDSTGARRAYSQALAIQQKLADQNPGDSEILRQLAATNHNLCILLYSAGDLVGAQAARSRALAIHQKMADDYPSVTEFQYALSTSRYNEGFLLAATGDIVGARGAYATALALRERLANANPGVPQFQADVAASLASLGWLFVRGGKPAGAIDDFAREEAIWTKLAATNPGIPDYRNSLANCQTNIATVLLRLGRPLQAKARCERAVALREELVSAHPGVPRYRQELAETLLRFGQTRQASGNLAGASADWQRALALFKTIADLYGEYVFYYAGCHASLSTLAGQPGAGIPAAEKTAEADKAMALLRRAALMGYRDPVTYRTETALDSLRGREDFRLLLLDLAFPIEALAPDR